MKQQPGWKAVYDNLPPNDKVAFAEVNCRESRELMQKHQVRTVNPPMCVCVRESVCVSPCALCVCVCVVGGGGGMGGWVSR
jgi:hypothetical protein